MSAGNQNPRFSGRGVVKTLKPVKQMMNSFNPYSIRNSLFAMDFFATKGQEKWVRKDQNLKLFLGVLTIPELEEVMNFLEKTK